MENTKNLTKYIRPIQIKTFFYRTCVSNVEILENEQTIKKRNKKVPILRKSFTKDKKMHIILEDKNISTVMNKLNLEFDALYGALQTPKNITCKEKIKIQDKEFSQNQNEIPFSKLNCNSVPNLGINHNCIKDNLNSILKFPLCKQASEKPELKSVKVELEKRSELYIPSVSKILEKTMSQESIENLQRWKKFMISKMGEEEFQKYQKELLANGQNLHACINEYLGVTPKLELCIEEAIAGHWESLKAIFPNINAIKLLEERIAHPFLCYKGIVDCLAEYKLENFKEEKNSLASTFDNPLQIAAYIGALNFDSRHQHKLSKGLIVVAYEDGSKASTLFMDERAVQRYWKEWLLRVKMYWDSIE